MRYFFIKAAYYVVTLLGRTIFRRAIEEHDIEERKKAITIVETVGLPPADIKKFKDYSNKKVE